MKHMYVVNAISLCSELLSLMGFIHSGQKQGSELSQTLSFGRLAVIKYQADQSSGL